MTITWSDIEDDLTLEDVLDELGVDLGPATVKGWHNTSCPLPTHTGADKNPSFGVNEYTLMFNCFTCDEQGSLAKLWSILKDIPYNQAVEEMATLAGINLGEDTEEIKSIMDWTDKAFEKAEQPVPRRERGPVLPYFDPGALDDLPYAPIKYFEKWGIRDSATIRAYGIRYDKAHTRFGYTGPALIVPHWVDSRLVGWQERWLDEDAPKRWSNSTDFPKEYTIFNYDRARALNEPTVVVEAAMTVARLHELDVTAVALIGAQTGERQLQLLAELPEVWLALDNDDAGRKATRKVRQYLEASTQVYLIPSPKHQKGDLADLDNETILDLISRRWHTLEWNGF